MSDDPDRNQCQASAFDEGADCPIGVPCIFAQRNEERCAG